jgi:hypothetical protein
VGKVVLRTEQSGEAQPVFAVTIIKGTFNMIRPVLAGHLGGHVKFNFDKEYCKNCGMRFGKDIPPSKPDNTGVHCPAGRKNNPMSLDATVNVIRNNGHVCSFNPARKHFGLSELHAMAR